MRSTRFPNPGTRLVAALLAALALGPWPGAGRAVASFHAGSYPAALVADADVALGSLGERSARGDLPDRGAGGAGGHAAPAALDRRGQPEPPAALRTPGPSAPDGAAARRSLERAGRPGAPATAPPRTS